MERALPALFWRPCLLLKNWKSRGGYLLNCQFSKSFFNAANIISQFFSECFFVLALNYYPATRKYLFGCLPRSVRWLQV